MKRESLNLALIVMVLLVFAGGFFYFYKGLKSDLNTIIAGKNVNAGVVDTTTVEPQRTTPVVEECLTPEPTQVPTDIKEPTPAIDIAYYAQVTPTPMEVGESYKCNRVIIYNTHPFEKMEPGTEITEYSRILSDKLNESGVLSIFLKNNNRLITDSYNKSRNLVTTNINEYSGDIILDIHASDDIHLSDKDVSIWIGKGNENYENNKEFADRLIKEINSIEPGMECEVVLKDTYLWNQDLSNKAILLIFGNKNISEDRISKAIEVLTTTVGNMQS